MTRRTSVDDPIQEWGQLLAYLPELKKALAPPRGPKVVLLPAPALSEKNYRDPRETLGKSAKDRSIAVEQVRRQALEEIDDWMASDDDPHRFDRIFHPSGR
ncbi:MAG: hypothetical protein KDA98_00505 [Acidimicrobiales bacterium]|nr:hypothetical protein [Acidimicrobiales bacterium]